MWNENKKFVKFEGGGHTLVRSIEYFKKGFDGDSVISLMATLGDDAIMSFITQEEHDCLEFHDETEDEEDIGGSDQEADFINRIYYPEEEYCQSCGWRPDCPSDKCANCSHIHANGIWRCEKCSAANLDKKPTCWNCQKIKDE